MTDPERKPEGGAAGEAEDGARAKLARVVKARRAKRREGWTREEETKGGGDPPLTLDDAVAILNRHRHRGKAQWSIARSRDGSIPEGEVWVYGPDQYDTMTEFEVVAIAEAYRRRGADPGGFDGRGEAG